MVIEATRDQNYVDDGATCEMNGMSISEVIEVSGDVVDLAITGTYSVNYDCQDVSGAKAATVRRTVIVTDTMTCNSYDVGENFNFYLNTSIKRSDN